MEAENKVFLDNLVSMGFELEQCKKALRATNNASVEEAIDWIVSNPREEQADAGKPAETPMEESASDAAAATGTIQITDTDRAKFSTVQLLDAEEETVKAGLDVLGDKSKVANEQPPDSSNPTTTTDANSYTASQSSDTGSAGDVQAGMTSLKCLDCNHICANVEKASLHAERTGHQNFDETKERPKEMTTEEREAKRKELEEMIKKKRLQNMEEDRKKSIEMEKKRRLQGQELTIAKQRMQEQEMKQIAEDRKREKKQSQDAKKKVLDQIKRDREIKRLEAEAEKNEGKKTAIDAPVSGNNQTQPSTNTNDSAQSYDECKLQLRLPNGKAMQQTFKAQETLAAVRVYLKMNRIDMPEGERETAPLTLMSTYPRKVFSEEDMETPLNALGLVPSAVLHVGK